MRILTEEALFEQEKSEALAQDCIDKICTCCEGSMYYKTYTSSEYTSKLSEDEFDDKMMDFDSDKKDLEDDVRRTMDEDYEHIEWNLACFAAYDEDNQDFVDDDRRDGMPTHEAVLSLIEKAEELGIKKYRIYVEDRCDVHDNETGDYHPSEDYVSTDIYQNY